MIQQVAFLVLAVVAVGAAVAVVTARSVFVSALWLVVSFLGVAGLYVLLEAGFLAMVQILVYVGAISVLILFAVMLTRDLMTEPRQTNRQWVLGLLGVVVLFGLLAGLAYRGEWTLSDGLVVPPAGGTVVTGVDPTTDDAAALAGAVRVSAPDGGGDAYVLPGALSMLGRAFMLDYLLAFEVVGAILLVAMVGAIVIARD